MSKSVESDQEMEKSGMITRSGMVVPVQRINKATLVEEKKQTPYIRIENVISQAVPNETSSLDQSIMSTDNNGPECEIIEDVEVTAPDQVTATTTTVEASQTVINHTPNKGKVHVASEAALQMGNVTSKYNELLLQKIEESTDNMVKLMKDFDNKGNEQENRESMEKRVQSLTAGLILNINIIRCQSSDIRESIGAAAAIILFGSINHTP